MLKLLKAIDRERRLKELKKQEEDALVEKIANRVIEKLEWFFWGCRGNSMFKRYWSYPLV